MSGKWDEDNSENYITANTITLRESKKTITHLPAPSPGAPSGTAYATLGQNGSECASGQGKVAV